MDVNILFPVLNEHLRLERGIRRALAYLRDLSSREGRQFTYQLTIVDNGSEDDTPQIGLGLSEEFPEVFYVRLEERGVGIAFQRGVELNTAPIVGYMDIDLSTDLSYIEKTLRMFEKNPDLDYVNASRFAKKSVTRGRRWYRRITSKGLLILLKLLFSMRATDAICGFTFVRKEKAEELVRVCSKDRGWFYMIEFLLRAERRGLQIYDMPVVWTEDHDTTVRMGRTIKNYLERMLALKLSFIREEKEDKKRIWKKAKRKQGTRRR